ncbi:SPFH domain-containing protein, partial [Vibrio cholerae]|uniref:SPFH domain-containing protein n=1 Tax=Vibrio cholerae TaxID=666 RepID=UPI0039C988A6
MKGWKYGFDSPFKAEVYFVNTHLFTDEKWGTKNAIIVNDDHWVATASQPWLEQWKTQGATGFNPFDA